MLHVSILFPSFLLPLSRTTSGRMWPLRGEAAMPSTIFCNVRQKDALQEGLYFLLQPI